MVLNNRTNVFDCCYRCPDRSASCHGKCEKYAAAKRAYEENGVEIIRGMQRRTEYGSYVFDKRKKYDRRKKKK